jgi:hypothetical protein
MHKYYFKILRQFVRLRNYVLNFTWRQLKLHHCVVLVGILCVFYYWQTIVQTVYWTLAFLYLFFVAILIAVLDG